MTTMKFLESVEQVFTAPPAAPTQERRIESIAVVVDGTLYPLTSEFVDAFELLWLALQAGRVVRLEAEEELVTPDRAKEILGVSRPTIYAWQDRGLLARVDKGNRRMVPAHDIARFQRDAAERARWRAEIAARPEPSDERTDAAAATFAGGIDLNTPDPRSETFCPPRRGRRHAGAA